jgi:hypothetical protein
MLLEGDDYLGWDFGYTDGGLVGEIFVFGGMNATLKGF